MILLGAGGAALATRRILRGDATAAGLSAILYAFGPVALGLLRPSPIFMAYAVAPWLVTAALEGPRSRFGLAWCAVFAFGVVAVAEHDLPALAYLLLLVAVAVVADRRRDVGHVSLADHVRWWAATAVACVTVGAFVWARLALSRNELVTRLALTEAPEAPAMTSSYSESVRGMGHWLTYFGLGTPPRPNLAPLLTSSWVVTATFAVVFVAMARALCAGDRRHALFGLVLVAGVVATVGIHPPDAPTPLGRAISWGFDNVTGLAALRNTSKAGPAVGLATAVLFGSAVSAAATRLGGRARSVLVVAAVGIVAVASLPVWTGDIYPDVAAAGEIPTYWVEAAAFLDELPETASVFITPGTASTRYTWGSVGDDIIAGLTDAHWVRSNGLLTSAALTADLVDALEESLTTRQRSYQSVAPLLDRLGIDYLLIRNDLDWRTGQLPPPGHFDALRADPGLRLEATFGPGDRPRIEVFAVERGSPVFIQPEGRDLVVVGSGSAVPVLDTHPELGSSGARRYLGDLTDAEVIAALEEGGAAVVTDTNPVRIRSVVGATVAESAPLSWERRPEDASAVFAGGSATTEPTFGDAEWIGSDALVLGSPWQRPEQAFDGSADTAWSVPVLFAGRPTLWIEFDEAVRADMIEVTAAAGYLRPLTLVADGVEVARSQVASMVRFDVADLEVTELQLVFDSIADGASGPLSVAEVTVGDLDLRPGRRVPTELFDRADANASLRDALGEAPLAFSFRREAGIGVPPVEVELRRSFRTDRDRVFALSGWLAGFFAEAAFDGCRDYVFVDESPVPVRATGPSDLVTGLTPFESCAPLDLAAGDHEVTGAALISLETLLIADTEFATAAADPSTPLGSGRIVSEHLDEIVLEVDVAAPSIVSSGVAHQPGWQVWVDGTPRPVLRADTLAAVRVDPGERTVVFRYGPQRWFRLAVLVSFAAGAAALVVLAGSGWHRYRPRATDADAVVASSSTDQRHQSCRRPGHGSPRWVTAPIAVAAGFAMAGIVGALVAAAAFGATVGGYRRPVAAVCLALLAAGAVLTVFEADLVASSNFALDRPWANHAAQHALVIFAAAMIAIVTRPNVPAEPPIGRDCARTPERI